MSNSNFSFSDVEYSIDKDDNTYSAYVYLLYEGKPVLAFEYESDYDSSVDFDMNDFMLNETYAGLLVSDGIQEYLDVFEYDFDFVDGSDFIARLIKDDSELHSHGWYYEFHPYVDDKCVPNFLDGLFSVRRLSMKKMADVYWETYKDGITEGVGIVDENELIDIYGEYVDESYFAIYTDRSDWRRPSMIGTVSHHVSGSEDYWSWDTYEDHGPGSLYGIDCGTCDSKEDAMDLCEQSFEYPGFTVGASKKADTDWGDDVYGVDVVFPDFVQFPAGGVDEAWMSYIDGFEYRIEVYRYGDRWNSLLIVDSNEQVVLRSAGDSFDEAVDAIEDYLLDNGYRFGSKKVLASDGRSLYEFCKDTQYADILMDLMAYKLDELGELDKVCNEVIDRYYFVEAKRNGSKRVAANYSKTYIVDKRKFRYNYDESILEWFIDEDEEGYEWFAEDDGVIDSYGLRRENWELDPEHWCEVMSDEIDEELRYLKSLGL